MHALVDLVEWCKEERDRLLAQLDALRTGKFRLGENHGSGWEDKTEESIERVTHAIDELDRIIADYGAYGPTA